MKSKSIMMRSDKELRKFFKEINLDRIKTGKSKIFISNRRMSLGLTRVPGLKKFMVESEFKDE